MSSVVLTLISIIVALGIEHLLGHISVQLGEHSGTARLLVVAQGAATFACIGAIWIAYATQLMTTGWEPRFQDFFAPLLILSLLYFWISAIGTSQTAWFYISTIGWAIGFAGNRYGLPDAVAARLKPRSSQASRALFWNLGLSVAAAAAGAASQLGALGTAGALALASIFAIVQLIAAWLHFQWWRGSGGAGGDVSG